VSVDVAPDRTREKDESKVGLRVLTLDDALRIAIELQRTARLAEAAEAYRELMGSAPDHPGVLHCAGVLAHQQGRSEEAVALIERSLALEPDQPDWYSNLGIVLKALGRLDEAVEAYRRAIRLAPDHANAHCNLGVILRAQGKLDEAEAAYRAAVRLAPEHAEAHHNLGVLLAATGRAREAVLSYSRALTLCPGSAATRTSLAAAYCILGEREEAVAIFEERLRESPEDPVARHMLAACSGKEVPARASDAYVESTFDDFAASFESKLESLQYRAPRLVAETLAASGVAPRKALAVLDAGCGTGLCGPLLAPYAACLIGVDLSSGMLREAARKGVYDELVRAEITAYLDAHAATYDLVVSADTLVYFGALEGVAGAASHAVRPGGLFVFTVEEAGEPETPWGYRINAHGRYSHQPAYVTAVLEGAGFRVDFARAELRMEAGVPVRGLVVRARRSAGGVSGGRP
jgi:predicted TPR repeat methyltransferase